MNRRGLVSLLGALGALAILVAVALLGEFGGERDEPRLLPDLKDQLNDIQRVVVTGAGDNTIATLERGAELWTVAERSNYPADVGRIRKNLLALAEARIVEEKTSNPGFYGRLGVQDVADQGASGVRLTLSGDPADGQPDGNAASSQLASVIIGQSQSGSTDYTYARRTGEAASWLVSGQFDIGKATGDWLDRLLTDIPADRIASVTITHPGQSTMRLTRTVKSAENGPAAAADFEVEGIPAGRELSYPGVASTVAAALADLQLEDVQTRDALGDAPGKPVVARFTTTNGLVVETSAWRLASGTGVTFLASGEGDAAQEADALNARLGGWVYTLPGYKTDLLTRRLAELLAPG